MRAFYTLIGLSLVAVLAGCAAQSGWTPTVDTYGDTRAQYVSRDTAECQALAQRAAGSAPAEAGKSALLGGLVGAAAGAAIGAVFGRAGTGAAVGAAAGGIGTGASAASSSDAAYKRAFNDCMRNRGHRVLS
ncbi:MAG: glycine zipper family protein [Gammaproteobacteria bacterium]